LILDLDGLISYNATKGGVEETFPFDENTLVFKVMGKMFAATSIFEEPLRVNLKCDPEWAIELRDEYPNVIPGFHMNKKHWNTVIIGEGNLEQSLILKMIDHSYNLVVKSLTRVKKLELEELKNEG
jgi:predicted DNA-binding protein (MmcQ/YjbR family)